MSVNKYKVRLEKGEKFINIPLSLTSAPIGQSDIIETNFVKKEIEKAINPIVDHEKIRLTPIQKNTKINRVDYSLNLLKDGVFPTTTTYGSEGFVNDDIKFRRNNFKRSFLNLAFFDSDVTTNQNYLGNLTLFSRISRFDMLGQVENSITPNEVAESSIVGSFDFSDSGLVGLIGPDTTEGSVDTNLKSGSSFATACSFNGSNYQTRDYVYQGLSYNAYLRGLRDGESCPSNLFTYKGTLLVGTNRAKIGVPYGMFDSVYRLSDSHVHNGFIYTVYAVWSNNMIFGGVVSYKVFFVKTGVVGSGNDDSVNTPGSGEVKDVFDIPLRFIVEDPIINPRGFAEGFYVYHEKAEIPNSIYMRGSFNNAKTGISTDLMTTRSPQKIDKVLEKLHVKYDLKRDGDIYYYELNTEYSDNITVSGNRMIVQLYEIQVL